MKTILTPSQRDNLVNQYNEPHRFYHNLEHITVLFQLASAHGVRLSIPQQLAIWYHDAIYEPGSVENEIKSAELLRTDCQSNCWLSQSIVYRAYDMVMATKRHLSSDNETQIILDLDLASLGFDRNSYEDSTVKIQKEFEFRTGSPIPKEKRILFLESLLSREYIFFTSWGRDFYERSARRNIQNELDILVNI
jgi:predicted metal-dependent HD superfamily phosphohydrolase